MVHKLRVLWIHVIVGIAVLPALALAQPSDLSLRQAIELALANNPQIPQYTLRSQALDGDLESAGLMPAMRVSTELENIIGTGDLKWFQGTELTLALSQIVELGDKRSARRGVVSTRQGLLSAQRKVNELEILSETTRRFIALAGVQQRREIMVRSAALAQQTYDVVLNRVEVGRAPEAELARALAALSMAELAVETSQYEFNAARFNLSSMWGQLNPEFASVTADLLEISETSAIESLLEKLEHNPQILVFADEERLRQAELREVQTRRYADIEVGAGIRHLAELNDTAFMIQASMPILNKNRNRGALNTARANLLLVDSERQAALLRMSTQLLSLDQQRQQAANEVEVLQTTILPQLNTALNETRIAFDNGRYSFIELSVAQKDLIDVEFSLIEAATRAHQLTAEIERLSGESFVEFSSEVIQ